VDPLSDHRLRVIFDHCLDAIVTMNQRGVITAWNPRAAGLFGWSADEAVGRVLAETIIPERYREQHERGLDRYLFSGEGPVLGQVLDHLMGLHRDGHEFPIELSISPAWQDGLEVTFVGFVRPYGAGQPREGANTQALERLGAVSDRLQRQQVAQAGSADGDQDGEVLAAIREIERVRELLSEGTEGPA
jgi:two-component system sensor histidine kinase UhpB